MDKMSSQHLPLPRVAPFVARPFDAKRSATSSLYTSSEATQNELMSLPPHLRQYVEPGLSPATMLGSASATQSALRPPLTGPKPEYDWRHQNDQCAPVNVNAYPGAVPWPDNAEGVEYVDRPQIKLQRTFGRDGKRLHVEGNTVHHPTGRQKLRFPVNGREADNFLRRMTGHDPHRRARGTVMQPTLMPDCSLGPSGEWGDTRAVPGLSLEDRAVEALNDMNIDTLGNGMLPFIQPDIHQWREQPVSYKKPTPQVRAPLLPDSRAGIFYQANPIGRDLRYSEPLPVLPHTAEGRRRPESIEHMQLPRESSRESAARAVMMAPVPHLSGGPTARSDETPIDDVAHRVLGKGAVPLMLTAIKRYHKKLQPTSSINYGAGIHDGDEAATAYDALSTGIAISADSAAQRTAALRREQPSALSTTLTGLAGGDDYDVVAYDSRGISVPLDDAERGVQRDALVSQAAYAGVQGNDEGDYASSAAARGLSLRAPARDASATLPTAIHVAHEYNDDAVAGASRYAAGQDVRDIEMQRKAQRRGVLANIDYGRIPADAVAEALDGRNAIGSADVRDIEQQGRGQRRGVSIDQYMTHDRADALSEYMDGQNAIGAINLSNKRGADDRALVRQQYDRNQPLDAEVAEIADRATAGQFGQQVREPRSATLSMQAPSGAHLVAPSGDANDLDMPNTVRASLASIGDTAQRLKALEGRRSAFQAVGAEQRARGAALQTDEPLADHVSTSVGFARQPRTDAQPANRRDTMRGIGVEFESAAATSVGQQTLDERPMRPASAPVLRDERQEAGRGLDGHLASVADALSVGDRGEVRVSDRARATRDSGLLHEPHRGAMSFADDDAAYGIADAFGGRQANVARMPRADALPLNTAIGGYGTLHENFEPSAADQRVATSDHRPPSERREATVAYRRRDNPDSDALTGLSRATASAHPQVDSAHKRLDNRESGSLESMANRYMYDSLHHAIGNEMLIAPPTTHLSRVHERTDGRESSVANRLRGRLRGETPPPASHMERNARFGRMLNASPSASPRGSRSNSPAAAMLF